MAPTLEKNTGHSGSFPDPAEFPDVTDVGAKPAAATLGRTAPPPKRVVSLPNIGTDPGEAALQLLIQTFPDSAGSTRTRIEELDERIDAEVESARLNESVQLKAFAQRVGVAVKARTELQARLARLDPTYQAPPPDVARDVCGYIRSVRRWRSGNQLRTELGALIKRTEVALHGPNGAEQAWMALGNGNPGIDKEHRSTLLDQPADQILRTAAAIHARRQRLSAQLEALGRPDARGKLVAAAIAEAGRSKVIAILEPSRHVLDSSAKMVEHKRNLDAQISRLDDESNRFRDLVAERDLLEQRIQSATTSATEARRQEAERLLLEAESGQLSAIAEVETLVFASLPALAQKLEQARGNDEQLVHVVAALLEPPPPVVCTQCGK
jgi:hypothetical protein